MTRPVRWLLVALVVLAVLAPAVLPKVLPADADAVSAATLADRVRATADTGWSGEVRTVGTLQVPDVGSFGNVADLFGEDSELRAWWRDKEHWRVDNTSSSGESDLTRNGDRAVSWSFGSRKATRTRYSAVRLPDESDVLPANLARRMLAGAKDSELRTLPDRRIEGHSSAGVRLVPADSRTTISRVDIWADPASGVATRVEVYSGTSTLPVLTTTISHLSLERPSAKVTSFRFAQGVDTRVSYAIDDAAGANAFAPFVPPGSLGGIERTGDLGGAVGVYGRGPTALLAIPLRRSLVREVYEQLEASPAAVEKKDADGDVVGVGLSVGPISVLLRGSGRAVFLLTGTVTPEALDRAGDDLDQVKYRPRRSTEEERP